MREWLRSDLVCGRYLKSVDRFQEWQASCWVTPGGMSPRIVYDVAAERGPAGTRFVILWDTKNDDGMRTFLHEAWESYVKVIIGLEGIVGLADANAGPPQPFQRGKCSNQKQSLRSKNKS